MANHQPPTTRSSDSLEQRKSDHLQLAEAAAASLPSDERFDYEPLLGIHPEHSELKEQKFLGKVMKAPLWISSMTGGTLQARPVNKLLAKVCGQYGLGMGLGSCRILLENEKQYFEDFNLRPILGDDRLLYANLGIAQVAQELNQNKVEKIIELMKKLEVDGLVVHINPLQEYFQNGGDSLSRTPLESLTRFLDIFPFPVIVKEVGQGMGPRSLEKLFELPIAGFELAAYGGTNFTKLENIRSGHGENEFSRVGHDALAMIKKINQINKKIDIIISGGVNQFLDGYYLQKLCRNNSVIGQASQILKYAVSGEKELEQYIEEFISLYKLSENYLRLRN
ncbi:MAG: type 2 isopentenyl-diphosphate Delta-isomerase [Halobacteriovoraceae bacterium]|nr:type 2 isopentenyl-diphosphate Delta-isomerase [Halobacteriovoraceae bacterium]